jgi:hypothetical protein
MAGRRGAGIRVTGPGNARITRTGVGRTGIRRPGLTGTRIRASRINLSRINASWITLSWINLSSRINLSWISAILVGGTRIRRTAGITRRLTLPGITLRRILPGITLDLVVLHQSALGLRRCITGRLGGAGRSSALLRCGSAWLSGGSSAVLAARPGRGQAQRQHCRGQSRPAHSARIGCPDHKSLSFGLLPKSAVVSSRYCCLKALPTDPAVGRCYPGSADREPRLPDLQAGPSDSSR